MSRPRQLAVKLRRVRMLLLDVDGVLTDGGLYYSSSGVEMKRFHAHDGYGVVRAREHGLKLAIISGRTTPVVTARARDLRIDEVIQGSDDKVAAMKKIKARHGLTEEQIAFIGDELFDIPLLKLVGFSAAPRNAQPEVKRVVDYVTKVRGGEGAVREVIDLILRSRTR